jgi:hypothetical protein
LPGNALPFAGCRKIFFLRDASGHNHPLCPPKISWDRIASLREWMIKINVNLTLIGDAMFDNVKFIDAGRA